MGSNRQAGDAPVLDEDQDAFGEELSEQPCNPFGLTPIASPALTSSGNRRALRPTMSW